MTPPRERMRSRKRQREDDTDGGQRLDKAQTPSTKNPEAQKRNVSFSRNPMPGARTSSPGHRTNASPQRSSIRPPTPQLYDLGRFGASADNCEVPRGAGRLLGGYSARSVEQNENNGRTIDNGPDRHHVENNVSAGKTPGESAARAKSPGKSAVKSPGKSAVKSPGESAVKSPGRSAAKSHGKSAAKTKASAIDNDPTKKNIYHKSSSKSPGKNKTAAENTNHSESRDAGQDSIRSSVHHEESGDGAADRDVPFDRVDDLHDDLVTEHIFGLTGLFQEAFSMIIDIAALFTPTPARQRRVTALDDLLASTANRESIAFANLICLGGPKGSESWEELLTDPDALQSLVVGLISYSVKTAIFDTSTFGLSKHEAGIVSEIQKSNLHAFAKEQAIREYLDPLPETSFIPSAGLLAIQIYKLILPFYDLGRRTKRTTDLPQLVLKPLIEVVSKLASVHRFMLQLPSVVFEMTTAFKDFEFSPSHMECFNVAEMLQTTPYTRPGNGGGGGVTLKAGHEHRRQSVVTILVSPGLVCYRTGGGSTATKELESQKAGFNPYTGESSGRESFTSPRDGYRRQVLMKNVVWLRWGRQQMLTRYLGRQAAFLKDVEDGEKPDVHLPLWNIYVARHAETSMR